MDDAAARAVAELVRMLPEGVVATSPDALEKYRFDWTHDVTRQRGPELVECLHGDAHGIMQPRAVTLDPMT